jgi:hypothetical protein
MNNEVMLKTGANRRIILWPIVAMLLLPVLHFHPGDSHGHPGYGTHNHGVVHADFFPWSAHDHESQGREHEDENSIPSQISLPALVSQGLTPLLTPSQISEFDILSEGLESLFTIVGFLRCFQEERSPPFSDASFILPSPRSPPSSF